MLKFKKKSQVLLLIQDGGFIFDATKIGERFLTLINFCFCNGGRNIFDTACVSAAFAPHVFIGVCTKFHAGSQNKSITSANLVLI